MTQDDLSDGFVKVFISSTYGDLKEERTELLHRLNRSVCAVGMEGFIPNGDSSQEKALLDEKRGLKSCDAAIFLITPRYGSLIKKCTIPDCMSSCPMKTTPGSKKASEKQRISYTHCEYKYAMGRNIPCQPYLIRNEWEILEKTDKITDSERPIKKEQKHRTDAWKRALAWKQELDENIFTKRLNSVYSDDIANDLAENLLGWYSNDKIKFQHFCGRKNELKILAELIQAGDTVEVCGIGGVGKTTLIQAALLIEILRGKKVVTVGKQQAYASGSGYRYFRENGHHTHKPIIGDTITLDDIGLALEIDYITEIDAETKKIQQITERLEEGDLILFIDDYHFAEKGVRKLIMRSDLPVVFSSKCRSDLAKGTVPVRGLAENERDSLIDEISKQHGGEIPEDTRERIKKIAEGHPVTTELLVRNFAKINFDNLSDFRQSCLNQMNDEQTDEFYRRIAGEVLRHESSKLMRILAVINTSGGCTIDRTVVENAFSDDRVSDCFNELISSGMIEKKGEGQYQFTFRHLQDAFQTDEPAIHRAALNYYSKKSETFNFSLNEHAEVLYHSLLSGEDGSFVDNFIVHAKNADPSENGYRRLLEIGELSQAKKFCENSIDFNFMLGNLLYDYNRFKKARLAYEKALEIYQRESPEQKSIRIAEIYNKLGGADRKLRYYTEAESNYFNACNELKSLNDQDVLRTEEYHILLADVLNNLGILYRQRGRYNDAGKKYEQALKIKRDLFRKNPEKYKPDLAQTYSNLGVLYRYMKRYAVAEDALLESLKIRKSLAKSNSAKYQKYVAFTLNNLGLLYTHWEKYDEAEKNLKEACRIKKELVDKSPEAYIPSLASTLNNLGMLYYRKKEFLKAEIILKETLTLKRALVHQNLQAHRPFLANSLNIIGKVYCDTDQYEQAENALREAFDIRSSLVKINPDIFERELANTLNCLGVLYARQNEYSLADCYFKKALLIQQKLAEISIEANTPYLLEILENIIALYQNQGNIEEEDKYTKMLNLGREALLNEKKGSNYLPSTGDPGRACNE